MSLRRARPVWVALAATAATRALLVLSAPQTLSTYDEATWKHGAVARMLADGHALDLDSLQRMALHPFNYHQPALVPWNLAYAGVAEVVGPGFLSLHGFMAASAVLGAGAWAALLHRHGPRGSAWAAAALFALLPLPAALLSVRPWSGHVEAQALAAAALAAAWGARTPRGALLAGLLAGCALSLSALALPLLVAGALGAALGRGGRPTVGTLTRLTAGLTAGLTPLWARELLSGGAFGQTPVLEDPLSLPGTILSGGFGVQLGDALWPPLHLVFHRDSIPAAHAWQGLPAGDSVAANGAAVAAALVALAWGLRATRPAQRALGLTIGLGPLLTLLMVGLAGPDLALRYLYGLYPLGAAALALTVGLAAAQTRRRRGALAAAALLALTWLGPGARDLARTADPARAALAAAYAPDRWAIPLQLDATPPLPLWPATERFLEGRAASACCASAMGFGAAFRSPDTRSAAGWQPPPDASPAQTTHALKLVAGQRAHGVAPGVETELVYRNLGVGLALHAGGVQAARAHLDAAGVRPTPEQGRWIAAGFAEAAALQP